MVLQPPEAPLPEELPRRTIAVMTSPTQTAADLLEDLQALPPIPGLADAVAAAVGTTPQNLAAAGLTGYHVSVGYETASVYLATPRAFALFEANSRGESYTLTVPIERVRRIGRLEDTARTRLVIELDADRSNAHIRIDDNGEMHGTLIPAGYELLEEEPEGRARLRAFGSALAQAVSGT